MASRAFCHLRVAGARLNHSNANLRWLRNSLGYPRLSLLHAGTPNATPTKILFRAASTNSEEFDLDAEIPPSKGAAAPSEPNPYPDGPLPVIEGEAPTGTDWSRSYSGLSTTPFPKEVSDILMAPIESDDIEIKPGLKDFTPGYCWY